MTSRVIVLSSLAGAFGAASTIIMKLFLNSLDDVKFNRLYLGFRKLDICYSMLTDGQEK